MNDRDRDPGQRTAEIVRKIERDTIPEAVQDTWLRLDGLFIGVACDQTG